jgi:diacylglycerol kinase (ATP)
VIHNPVSGGGSLDRGRLRAALADLHPEWVTLRGPGEAREAAREWRDGLLVVAGGDGTVHEVVNGLGEAGFPGGVTLAVLPVGTGNDLAATLGMPTDLEEAAAAIGAGRTRVLDAGRVRSRGLGEAFFVNAAVGGVGVAVSKAADDEAFKGRWGRLAYLRASLGVVRGLETWEARISVDGEEHVLSAASVVVGNGRYAGGGWPVAPAADPEDGLLDLVAIEDVSLKEMLALVPRALLRADYRRSPGVFAVRGRGIRIQTVPPGGLEFNADGELIGHGPFVFSVVPRALNVVVGPGYEPQFESGADVPVGERGRAKGRDACAPARGGRGAGQAPPER